MADESTTRDFHIGDILSVTTECLVSPSLNGVYDILNWMTGDNLFTHQLPRAALECAGPLLAQHPDLAAVVVPADLDKDTWRAWMDEQVATFGETRPVAPLAAAEHTRIHPLQELRMMAPDVPIIPVVLPRPTQEGEGTDG